MKLFGWLTPFVAKKFRATIPSAFVPLSKSAVLVHVVVETAAAGGATRTTPDRRPAMTMSATRIQGERLNSAPPYAAGFARRFRRTKKIVSATAMIGTATYTKTNTGGPWRRRTSVATHPSVRSTEAPTRLPSSVMTSFPEASYAKGGWRLSRTSEKSRNPTSPSTGERRTIQEIPTNRTRKPRLYAAYWTGGAWFRKASLETSAGSTTNTQRTVKVAMARNARTRRARGTSMAHLAGRKTSTTRTLSRRSSFRAA